MLTLFLVIIVCLMIVSHMVLAGIGDVAGGVQGHLPRSPGLLSDEVSAAQAKLSRARVGGPYGSGNHTHDLKHMLYSFELPFPHSPGFVSYQYCFSRQLESKRLKNPEQKKLTIAI